MIQITIPNNNINERKYIIDILFKEFLGLPYRAIIGNEDSNYDIVLENGNKLIIEDHFFNEFPKDLEYLKEEYIPKKVEFSKNDFIVENDIPIIYGKNKVTVTRDSDRKIIDCGIDIFASSFFMLTRWEEYVNKTRDKHDRFPATASLAFKNNFLDRPVVNEYVEMLWNMLKFLGCEQDRKKREYELVLTHDIDVSYKYTSSLIGTREIIGDIVKRKNIKLAISNVKGMILTKLQLQKDPYDTYDYLMDISEKVGVKSHFFLHSSNSTKQDINNEKFFKKIAEKITKRGHVVGYHPSYNAYNDFKLFMKDKKRIENIIEKKLKTGRAHFLRFEVPTTWQIWEDAGMKWDSTLSFADKEGFRCGVCYKYSVFNILTRKKLKLKEIPLIVMDGSFVTYQPNIKPQEMEDKINKLIETVKKYNGEFVFLWHNSSFNTPMWEKYQYIYEKVTQL